MENAEYLQEATLQQAIRKHPLRRRLARVSCCAGRLEWTLPQVQWYKVASALKLYIRRLPPFQKAHYMHLNFPWLLCRYTSAQYPTGLLLWNRLVREAKNIAAIASFRVRCLQGTVCPSLKHPIWYLKWLCEINPADAVRLLESAVILSDLASLPKIDYFFDSLFGSYQKDVTFFLCFLSIPLLAIVMKISHTLLLQISRSWGRSRHDPDGCRTLYTIYGSQALHLWCHAEIFKQRLNDFKTLGYWRKCWMRKA